MDTKKSFIVIDHKTEKIDLTHLQSVIPMLPIEIHHKENGDIDNNPSFAVVMSSPNFPILFNVVGEISLKMLNEALNQIGYEIKKTT
jgi:hypothetical protein